ncbi:MAG: metallopeptidase family protein [Phycisphaerales bacterium]|nr:metallopeptidase family protein [Phycisphaerales bacterium]
MRESERDRFDALLERVLGALPEGLLDLLDEVPLIVLDEPTPEMLRDLGVPRSQWTAEAHMLCGLHSGTMLTERSVEASGELPDQVHLFRRGIVRAAGGWDDEVALVEEIRVTVLHELGHHFGLDEEDLDRLGYS